MLGWMWFQSQTASTGHLAALSDFMTTLITLFLSRTRSTGPFPHVLILLHSSTSLHSHSQAGSTALLAYIWTSIHYQPSDRFNPKRAPQAIYPSSSALALTRSITVSIPNGLHRPFSLVLH